MADVWVPRIQGISIVSAIERMENDYERVLRIESGNVERAIDGDGVPIDTRGACTVRPKVQRVVAAAIQLGVTGGQSAGAIAGRNCSAAVNVDTADRA